jgi:hypothetical protein
MGSDWTAIAAIDMPELRHPALILASPDGARWIAQMDADALLGGSWTYIRTLLDANASRIGVALCETIRDLYCPLRLRGRRTLIAWPWRPVAALIAERAGDAQADRAGRIAAAAAAIRAVSPDLLTPTEQPATEPVEDDTEDETAELALDHRTIDGAPLLLIDGEVHARLRQLPHLSLSARDLLADELEYLVEIAPEDLPAGTPSGAGPWVALADVARHAPPSLRGAIAGLDAPMPSGTAGHAQLAAAIDIAPDREILGVSDPGDRHDPVVDSMRELGDQVALLTERFHALSNHAQSLELRVLHHETMLRRAVQSIADQLYAPRATTDRGEEAH